MGLVVELERVIGVREVLIRLSFDFSVGFDPVKKLRALARVFIHRILISFNRFVMPRFLGQRGLTTVARNVFRKIVAASESRNIENSSTNHNRNAGHIIQESFFSIRKNLLVFEILFQRYASSHDGSEFGIVHDVAARVGSEVLFSDFFRNPANAGGYAGKSCSVKDRFHKLVVRHGIMKRLFFQTVEVAKKKPVNHVLLFVVIVKFTAILTHNFSDNLQSFFTWRC